MATNERGPWHGEKQFRIQCDNCSLACETTGRTEAEHVASHHHEATGHDVVAVEWPL